MAEKDQIDHDALAAEWGVALEAEQNPASKPEVTAETAAVNPADALASQWGAMADDSQFMQANKGGAERVLTQEEIELAARLQSHRYFAQR